jgi:hypothetical protein
MSRQTATALLERIVRDQRKIIEEVTGKPASETPQLWALYKEVQDYYDKGMRVPDDVTLLLCDDNWGNLRKLPKLTDPPRKGGYGIYYHFDYVGGPRNYKWINTNNIARVWEQMHLAYEYGVKQIWIVNVGDIKPMEFPISFFLDYAWDPSKWDEGNLRQYYSKWATNQFGSLHAKEIGDLIRKYSQYASRRKPELLDANTYQLDDIGYDNELQRVLNEWYELLHAAEKINSLLSHDYKNAFFQLVLHPIKAFANLHHLYGAVAYNKHYLKRNWPDANRWADYAKSCYEKDSLITLEYHQLANGKWNHMMDQTHIGYTYWQQPPKQKMPEVSYVSSGEQQPPPELEEVSNSSRDSTPPNKANVFYELDGVVSIQSSNWTKAINSITFQWKIIPDIGRDGDGVTLLPPADRKWELSEKSPRLEFEIYTYSRDSLRINAYFSPTLNYHNTEQGLQYAIAIDEEEPQIISLNKEDRNTGTGIWNRWVADNIIVKTSRHKIEKPGKHIVKYWMVNSGVVLQKLVLDFGGVKPSYLGPPETRRK